MAKKKSKAQKSKKNTKKKIQKVSTISTKTKETESKNKPTSTQTRSSKRIVDKDKVKYNVVLTGKSLKQTNKPTTTNKNNYKKAIINILNLILSFFKKISLKLTNSIKKIYNKLTDKIKKTPPKKSKPKKIVKKKNIQKKSTKNTSKKEIKESKNPIINILLKLYRNIHIIFNSALIITYIILLIGLIRTEVFSKGTIIYISCIVIFLMIVAICYNKYISGKIYSLLIIIGMSVAIYQMQYTYDFFRNLNTKQYEYKEYYVVTFNNGRNKSIYNINNKKVGLLKENSTNIERILNIKLDKINYIEYEDPNKLYSDFYNQEYRAIIVNENQYRYLKNNIEPNSRSVKILYTFKANGKK